MQVEALAGSITEIVCDTLVVNLFEGITVPAGATGAIDEALDGQISNIIRDHSDAGKYGNITVLHLCSGIGAKRVILLGLGKKDDLNLDKLRALAGIAIRAAAKLESKSVATIVHGAGIGGWNPEDAAQMLVEGSILGNYRFQHYKSEKKSGPFPEKLYIVENDAQKIPAVQAGAERGGIIAAAVNLARDLVNHPANHMTPTRMACHAAEIADKFGLDINVLDKEQIDELKMHAFLAVSQGSHEPPKLIILKYNGAPGDKRLIAMIGKGITFDSGGISLKPSEGMHEMKDDMAGAAAVLGAMQAIAALKPAVNILAVVPCTENLPSGYAFRPGDVISSMDGKTIEIISTDAEGRLILADAVTYARKLGATHIVDLATLTGACVVALGNITSGIMGNETEWKGQILAAAARAGEKMWELPMHDEYKDQIKSDIADLKNSGGRQAGAITAGLFIANFADNTPWVHIDIAGTVTSDKDSGYNVKGPTGVGVRTLVQLAATLSKA